MWRAYAVCGCACRGQHYFEVSFSHSKSQGYTKHQALGTCYYVGVVRDTGNNITYTDSMGDPSNEQDAWGMHDGNGEKHHGQGTGNEPYAKMYGEMDPVGVLVDMDAHTICMCTSLSMLRDALFLFSLCVCCTAVVCLLAM